MKESELIKSALVWLKKQPGMYFRINSGVIMIPQPGKKPRMVRLAPPGTSDILGVLPNGKFIALEAKVGTNKATPKQLEFLAKVIRCGGHGLVFYSLGELKAYWKGGWKNNANSR